MVAQNKTLGSSFLSSFSNNHPLYKQICRLYLQNLSIIQTLISHTATTLNQPTVISPTTAKCLLPSSYSQYGLHIFKPPMWSMPILLESLKYLLKSHDYKSRPSKIIFDPSSPRFLLWAHLLLSLCSSPRDLLAVPWIDQCTSTSRLWNGGCPCV